MIMMQYKKVLMLQIYVITLKFIDNVWKSNLTCWFQIHLLLTFVLQLDIISFTPIIIT